MHVTAPDRLAYVKSTLLSDQNNQFCADMLQATRGLVLRSARSATTFVRTGQIRATLRTQPRSAGTRGIRAKHQSKNTIGKRFT